MVIRKELVKEVTPIALPAGGRIVLSPVRFDQIRESGQMSEIKKLR